MPIDKLDRFLEDVGYSLTGSEVPENSLWRKTAAFRSTYPDDIKGQWQSNAKLIAEVIGTAVESALNPGLTGKGMPVPESELSKYEIVSGYGWRLNPGPRHHHGVDISPKDGASLRMVAGLTGIVIQKTFVPGYGNVLALKSNDSFNGQSIILFYAHLASYASGVEIGALIKQGRDVAVMGKTPGGATALHLHYEVRVGRNDKAATWNPTTVFPDLKTKIAYSKGSVTEFSNYQQLARVHPLDRAPKSGDSLV